VFQNFFAEEKCSKKWAQVFSSNFSLEVVFIVKITKETVPRYLRYQQKKFQEPSLKNTNLLF